MSRLAFAVALFIAFVAPACGGGGDEPSGNGGSSGDGGNGGATSGAGGSGAGGSAGTLTGGNGGASTGGVNGGASGNGVPGGSSGVGGDGGSGEAGSSGASGNAGQATGGNGGDAAGGTSGTAGSGGAANGGAGTSGSGGRGGQGGQCGTIENGAPSVPETQRTGSPPAPMGGNVADGTYYLTAWNVYPPGNADADMHGATLRIASGTFEIVVDGTTRQSGTIAAAGVVLGMTPTCPGGAGIMRPYSATATTLSLQTVSENRVETLTKQ